MINGILLHRTDVTSM